MNSLNHLVCTLLFTISACGQGQVNFNNFSQNGGAGAPIWLGWPYNNGPLRGPGADAIAGLFTITGPSETLQATALFYTTPGADFLISLSNSQGSTDGTVTLAGIPENTSGVLFAIKVWGKEFASYNSAVAAGGLYGDPQLFTGDVGPLTLPPNNLNNFPGMYVGIVPEPSTLSLSAVGVAALLVAGQFRKKPQRLKQEENSSVRKAVSGLTAVLLAGATAYGQGQVNFNNFSQNGGVGAPIYWYGSQDANTGDEIAGLYVILGGVEVLVATAPFYKTPGGEFFISLSNSQGNNDGTVTIPGVAPNTRNVLFQVKVWPSEYATWDIAQGLARCASPASPIFSGDVGPDTLPPNNLDNLQSFATLCPEPSTIVLSLMGALALFFCRRNLRTV